MNALAIECSCQLGSVAVLNDGVVIKSWEFESPRGRGGELFSHLESALRDCGHLDLVVVGTGPGRYNGLRMSIAAAWGIAKARGARLAGVSSLLGYDAREYFVVGDARAGQWFLAHVADGKFLSPEAVVAAPCAGELAKRDLVAGLPAPAYLKPPHITKPAARN